MNRWTQEGTCANTVVQVGHSAVYSYTHDITHMGVFVPFYCHGPKARAEIPQSTQPAHPRLPPTQREPGRTLRSVFRLPGVTFKNPRLQTTAHHPPQVSSQPTWSHQLLFSESLLICPHPCPISPDRNKDFHHQSSD